MTSTTLIKIVMSERILIPPSCFLPQLCETSFSIPLPFERKPTTKAPVKVAPRCHYIYPKLIERKIPHAQVANKRYRPESQLEKIIRVNSTRKTILNLFRDGKRRSSIAFSGDRKMDAARPRLAHGRRKGGILLVGIRAAVFAVQDLDAAKL